MYSHLTGKGIKINPLTDYYKSVFSILFREIINNPSVSTQFSYGLLVKSSTFFVSCALSCSL